MAGINPRDFRRLEDATKYVETKARNVPPPADPPRLNIPMRVFWTTSTITSATVTGTTTANAKRVLGFGMARPCILNATGDDIPDTNAADMKIYNGVVMTTPAAINAAMFCDCAFIRGKWRVVTVHKCPT